MIILLIIDVNGGAHGTRDAVVVRLAETTEGSDPRLDQLVLRQV
jgi:hypothetical protein